MLLPHYRLNFHDFSMQFLASSSFNELFIRKISWYDKHGFSILHSLFDVIFVLPQPGEFIDECVWIRLEVDNYNYAIHIHAFELLEEE